MTFNEKLVRLRKLKSLTQDEFASAVGVSRQAVYKWESGQSYPEVPKLIEIKMLFGISIDDLLDETYEVEMPEKKRRKRISRADRERIEKEVLSEEGMITDEEIKEETEVVEDFVQEPEAITTVEEKEITKEEPEENTYSPVEPEAEPVTEPEIAEEPAVSDEKEEASSSEDEKQQKKGFFARLFSKK